MGVTRPAAVGGRPVAQREMGRGAAAQTWFRHGALG